MIRHIEDPPPECTVEATNCVNPKGAFSIINYHR